MVVTQLLSQTLQIVQIIGHGVGKVHEDVEVKWPKAWIKHFHLHFPLLSWQQGHPHLLRSDLRVLLINVNLFILKDSLCNISASYHS